MDRLDVAVLGEIILDMIHYLPRLPSGRDTWHRGVRAERVVICPGGSALYCAQSISKLGGKSGTVGKIGNDAFGRFLIDSLEKENVDTKCIKICDIETPTCSILVLRHKQKIILGGAGSRWDLQLEDVDLDYICSARFFHFGGYYLYPRMWGESTVKIMKYCQAHGLTTSLDTQMDRSGKYAGKINDVLKYVNILFVDEFEAKAMTGESSVSKASVKLANHGPDVVAIKLGKRGCYVSTKKQAVEVPAFKVRVMDTVGSGDAWDAGFIFSQLNGEDFEKSAEFANAVAGFSVMGPGGASNVPERRGVETFIRKAHQLARMGTSRSRKSQVRDSAV